MANSQVNPTSASKSPDTNVKHVDDRALLEQIKVILRRDLKLGADEPISDDMPLIGGDTPLDSIDILLLLSSFEQELGVRIPDRDVGRDVFKSVATLADYVSRNRGELEVQSQLNEQPSALSWRHMLPHGDAFLFVSEVRELAPGQHCKATWSVSGDEWFFPAHFPGRPLVPGVLVTEALAQTAGLAAVSTSADHDGDAGDASEQRGGGGATVLSRSDITFEAPVAPPVQIELDARVTSVAEALRVCDVVASVRGQAVARGTITLHHHEG